MSVGNKYFKTELEKELVIAFQSRETYFFEFERDLIKEILKNGSLREPVSKEIRLYLAQKMMSYKAAQNSLAGGWNESFADIICEGMFAKKGNFYKQRFGEINGFMIDYKPIIENIEEVEKAYSENSVAERLIVSCLREGTADSALYLLCLGGNINQLGMAKSYKREYPNFAEYRKGQKLDAKKFVNDLMRLMGA